MSTTEQGTRGEGAVARRMKFYRDMVRIQAFELRLLRLIDEGRVSGFYHAGRGHEAVAVGGCAPLRDDDYLFYDHRGVGQQIAKGLSLDRLYGDFLATEHGTCRGLGAGIVHIAAPEIGIMGQPGTLGGGHVMGAGTALSAQYRGTDQVTLVYFGDGAGNRGTFHEAANVAGAWNLPLILLCENNGFAVSVPIEESTAVQDLTLRAAGYGMPGVAVDGMNVEAVADVVGDAVDRARRGDGPSFIEAKVYRYRGHFEGDPAKYRTKEALDAWKARDPILAAEALLREDGALTDSVVQQIQSEADSEVEAAVELAASAPMSTRERLLEGVYA